MNKKRLIKFWIGKMVQHFRKCNFQIDPLPTIVFLDEANDEDNLLIPTGNYDWSTRTVTLCISNRHLKDILRTFCHEMIHHHQYLDNPNYFKRVPKDGSLESNSELKEIESEAFLLGNLYFRSFTETFTHN